MEIKPPTAQPAVMRALPSGPKGVAAWQVGQVLHAVASSGLERGSVLLRIGSETVRAHTTLSVRTGQPLALEVVSLGPRPILRPLALSGMQEIVARAMRSALPRQTPLPQLLANLLAMTAATQPGLPGDRARSGGALPAEVLHLIKTTVHGIASTKQVSTSSGLKAALHDSGAYLERRLARLAGPSTTSADPAESKQDLKANLLRLLRALASFHKDSTDGSTRGPHANAKSSSNLTVPNAAPTARFLTNALSPPHNAVMQPQKAPLATLNPQSSIMQVIGELIQQTQGALARIELTQLASLPSDDTLDLSWVVDLPVRNKEEIDVIRARIEHRKPNGQEDQEVWSVTLRFDLESLGPVHATISLAGEALATVFWAEHGASASRIRDHLDLLRAKLHSAGLTVGKMECRHGPCPSPEPRKLTPRIVDEKA